MRLKRVFMILGLTISFLSILILVVLPAASQEVGTSGATLMLNGIEDDFTLLSDNSVEAPLAGTMVSTNTIEVYTPFKEFRSHYAAEVTGMPSGTYTWQMEHLPPDTIDDIFYDWTGGSGCTIQSNNNIVCGSGINYFYVEFRYSSPYSPTSNFISLGAGGSSSGFAPDYTATLNYVEPLMFITSTLYSTATPIEPISHSNTTLRWQIPNTTDANIVATFYDPRISMVYLPLVTK